MKLYAAYGLDMIYDELVLKLGRNHVQIVGKALVWDHQLVFRGKAAGRALPSLDHREGMVTPCVLYVIDSCGENILDDLFGSKNYEKCYFTVEFCGKRMEDSMGYTQRPGVPLELPSAELIEKMTEIYELQCMSMGVLNRALDNCKAASAARARKQMRILKNTMTDEEENLSLQRKNAALSSLEMYMTLPAEMQAKLANRIATSAREAGLSRSERDSFFPSVSTGLLESAQDGSVSSTLLLLLEEIEDRHFRNANTLIKLVSAEDWKEIGKIRQYRWNEDKNLDAAIICTISAAVSQSERPEVLAEMKDIIRNANPDIAEFIESLRNI